jgi:hypothetical protein
MVRPSALIPLTIMLIPTTINAIESMKTRSIRPKVVGLTIMKMDTTAQRIPMPRDRDLFIAPLLISLPFIAWIMRAIPTTRKAMAARMINKAVLNTGNSIRTIERPITKSPSAIFVIEILFFETFGIVVVVVGVVVVVVVAVVLVVAVGPTTPKQTLSIPRTSKIRDKRSTVVEMAVPGTNKVMPANRTQSDPSTIWSIRSHGGLLTICIIWALLGTWVRTSYIRISIGQFSVDFLEMMRTMRKMRTIKTKDKFGN